MTPHIEPERALPVALVQIDQALSRLREAELYAAGFGAKIAALAEELVAVKAEVEREWRTRIAAMRE